MFLLNTHYLLWLLYEPNKISDQGLKILKDTKTPIYYSSVSTLKIAIKESLSKIEVNDNISQIV